MLEEEEEGVDLMSTPLRDQKEFKELGGSFVQSESPQQVTKNKSAAFNSRRDRSRSNLGRSAAA